MKFILASQSPRRKELLSRVVSDFDVRVSHVEEVVPAGLQPQEVVMHLAKIKAEAVARELRLEQPAQRFAVIGADTVVALDHQIMGKPKDEADALRMLRQLQGEMHSVFTGVTLIVKENGSVISKQTFSQETRVYLYAMTDEEIQDYIATGEPMDKAGAYGIQGRFAAYVEGIEGDYNNVVGLPVSAVWQEIKEFCV